MGIIVYWDESWTSLVFFLSFWDPAVDWAAEFEESKRIQKRFRGCTNSNQGNPDPTFLCSKWFEIESFGSIDFVCAYMNEYTHMLFVF